MTDLQPWDTPPDEAVRGRLTGATGAILDGSGFTVVRNATGLYTITFTTAYAAPPTVFADALAAANRIVTLVAVAAGSFQVQVRDAAGTVQDPTELHFTAVGARL
jgi:hypothetical protein